MVRRNWFLVVALVLISIVAGSEAARYKGRKQQGIGSRSDIPETEIEATQPEPTQDDDFDWQLVKTIFSKEHGNTAVSTFSVKFLLNMIYEGASSTTQKELAEHLGRSLQPSKASKPNVVTAINVIQSTHDQLVCLSRIFVDQRINVTQKYTSTVEMTYNSSIAEVNFQQREEAATIINRWVSEGTRGIISELVTPQSIDGSVMLLANTLYFKGLWSSVFSEAATETKPFRMGTGHTVNVPFMKQIAEHYHTESRQLNANLLRLTYTGARFAMILVLPHENSDMNQLLQALSADAIHQAIASMEEVEVKIELPRFHIDYSTSMKEPLQQLGINRIFQDTAELSLITRGSPLKVSDVFQRTVIDVDEKGSTAGSASGSSLVFTIASEPEQFVADRPFLFFIEEESTGTLLFAGKVEDPSRFREAPHVW